MRRYRIFLAVLVALLSVSILPKSAQCVSAYKMKAKVYMTGKVSGKKYYIGKIKFSKPEGAAYYRVYRKKASSSKWTRISSKKYTKRKLSMKLGKKVTYNFLVKAYDSEGRKIASSRILKLKARRYSNTAVSISGIPVYYAGEAQKFKAKGNRYASTFEWEFSKNKDSLSKVSTVSDVKIKVKALKEGRMKIKAISENGFEKTITLTFVKQPEEGDPGNPEIVKTAAAEVGYMEKKSNKYLDDKEKNAGSNNYNKYARDLKVQNGGGPSSGAWCSYFVSWVLWKNDYIKKSETKGLADSWRYPEYLSKSIGKYYVSKTYIPVPGDIIMFDYEPNDFANHVGIVEKYEGGKIYTIEGNKSNMVKRCSYSITHVYIMGITHLTRIEDVAQENAVKYLPEEEYEQEENVPAEENDTEEPAQEETQSDTFEVPGE